MQLSVSEIVQELSLLISEGNNEVLTTGRNLELGGSIVDSHKYDSWRAKCLHFLKLFLDENDDFIAAIEGKKKNYYENARSIMMTLNDIVEYVAKGYISVGDNQHSNTASYLDRIFARFHVVARQLSKRHSNRDTLNIEDEYDVQDLLHAILKLFFDDVRAEEWTPSYAGKSSRMDFLLKKEKFVIEIKKTRSGLTDKEIGDQLIVDIERYRAHPDCKKLICFVYDPEGRVGNPEGLASDLTSRHEGFVEVIIKP